MVEEWRIYRLSGLSILCKCLPKVNRRATTGSCLFDFCVSGESSSLSDHDGDAPAFVQTLSARCETNHGSDTHHDEDCFSCSGDALCHACNPLSEHGRCQLRVDSGGNTRGAAD